MKKRFPVLLISFVIAFWMISCTFMTLDGGIDQLSDDAAVVYESEPESYPSEASKVTNTSVPTSIPTNTAIPAVEFTPTVDATFTPNPYLTPTPFREAQSPSEYNPLTGKNVVYPENLLRSPLMVKISNYPREIRPQAGLSKADIVFEYYIGAFMNRFLAVFYGENAEWAGPIRSGRLIDGQLALNYHSALVYGGADERVDEVLEDPAVLGDKAVDTRVYDQCPPLCGEETHSLEGLYVDTAGMSEDLFNDGYDVQMKPKELERMKFSEEIPEEYSSIPVNEIEIIFSNLCRSKWLLDEASQLYFRWEEEADDSPNYVETVDLLNPEYQIQVENIVILYSDYVVYDSMLHDVRIHYADGLMPALFFREGQMIEGFWSGLEKDQPLHFTTEDGVEYAFAPGKSWIVFVTEDSIFSQIKESAWRLEFATP